MTSGVQPPQVVPALVFVFRAPTVVQPLSMAAQMPPEEMEFFWRSCLAMIADEEAEYSQ